jgi:type I restriction enzyme R subunit
VAVREFPLKTGEADYLLFVDRKAVGAIETKSEGTTLSGVDVQSDKYLIGVSEKLPHFQNPYLLRMKAREQRPYSGI